MLPATIACIVFNAVVSSIPSVFMQNIIAVIENNWQEGDWGAVGGQILRLVSILAVFYILSLAAGFTFNQLMAIITQGTLKKMREKMFGKMQRLPIKYFDTNDHGDIMSYYTNDIDTLRQMISQSFPQLLISRYYCTDYLRDHGVLLPLADSGGRPGSSGNDCADHEKSRRRFGKVFLSKQQNALGKVEGFIEEMMYGQKVIKVFCHEEESEADFDRYNDILFEESRKANQYANILGPILNNIGNILYVLVAITGGILLTLNVPNVSVSGIPIGISIVVPFLNMTKQFAGNVARCPIR